MAKKELIRIDADNEYTQTIYNSVAGTGSDQDAVTSVTVHHDGYLVGIHMTSWITATATGDYYNVELSRSGNFQAQTSDNPDSIMVQVALLQLATQGASKLATVSTIRTKQFFRAGDRIYLNQLGTSAKVISAQATLFWTNA